MSKIIKISDEAAEMLDTLKHEGQSYDGLLKEILRDKIADLQRQQTNSQQSEFRPVPKPIKIKKTNKRR
jgi:predicted CopG family antitoxin